MAERALSEEDIFKPSAVADESCRICITISSPRRMEEAKEQLARSRVVVLELSDPYGREGTEVEEVMHLTGGNVDAKVVDSLNKLVRERDFCSEELRGGLQSLSRSNSSQLQVSRSMVEALAGELGGSNAGMAETMVERILERGITAEMAKTMVERILPEIDASHHLALAQALEMLVSFGMVEDLSIELGRDSKSFLIYEGWGDFFHDALSSHDSRLRTLSIDGSRKLLDKGASRKLFAALSKSNLQQLTWLDDGLYQEEEEILSRAIISPGCNLQRLHISSGTLELKNLSSALVHPNCKIWDLSVNFNHPSQSAALALGDVLRNEKNRLLKLCLKGAPQYIPWEAMEDPACKLEALIPIPQFIRFDVCALARLLHAARAKIWYLEVTCVPKGIAEALRHSKVTHVVLHFLGEDSDVSALADFLGSAHCKLECFQCSTHFEKRDAEELINALETNYQSRLKTLLVRSDFYSANVNKILQQRCEHIVKRNALFLASTHDQQPFVAANSAKLFICGHSGAGKTTIARNFNRRVTLPASLQRHSTTQGIDMGVLDYNGKKAIICDIAGQEEFHAFHHYFVKGSQSNLFLVVCKVVNDGDNSNMEDELKYWLRFISSHRALSSRRKPKVVIALNYHMQHGNGEFQRTYVEVVNELAEKYTGLLDIYKDGGGDMCFQVVALRATALKPIKDAVGVALEDVLGNHPQVPSLCKNVRDSIKDKNKTRWWWGKNETQQQRVVTIEELTQRVLAGDDDNKAARTSAVKFTMACMHDMGEALYFGVDYENDEVLANSATLDMQWFVQGFVGFFIQVCRDDDWYWRKRPRAQRQIQMQQDDYKVSMINIVPKIEKMCSPDHLGYVLKALHKMGVLLPSDDNWNGTWSRTHPKQVIVPALLQNEFSGTNWGSDGYIYWGRRMACKDHVCTLLPSGMFNVMQVKMKELCKNPSFRLGKGWICFEENRICVVVRVGGDTHHWVDRQWVDIMVMTLEEHKKCLLAEDMVNRIKSFVAEECQSSLELVEYIINPTHVKARVQDDIKQAAETMVVPLEHIYKEVLEEDEGYTHTWDTKESNEVAELLMPTELQGCVKNWVSSIRIDYNEYVASVYNITEVEPWEDFFEAQNYPTSTTVNPELLKFLIQQLHTINQQLHNINQQLVGIAAGINDLKAVAKHTQLSMQLYGNKVLAQCSKMLDKVNVDCPRYPYFTDLNNKITKHSLVVAERVKLHYCCESSTKGIHKVDGSDGLVLELARDWFRKYSHIIVPALTGIYFALKITGKALGAGDIFDFVLDFSKEKVQDILNSVLTPELAKNRKQPTESDINEVFAMVKSKAKDQRIERFMMNKFGLQRKNQAWLCRRCFSEACL